MSLSLSCLLGLSWLSGFLLYAEPIFFAYLFTVTNGLQGVTILLFRCVLNDEIRTAVVDRYKRRRNTRRVKILSTLVTIWIEFVLIDVQLGRSTSTVTRTTISQRRRSELEDTSSKLKLRTDRQSVSSSGIISSDNSTEQLWNYKASGKATATNQQQPRRYPVIRTISGNRYQCIKYLSNLTNSSNSLFRHGIFRRFQLRRSPYVTEQHRLIGLSRPWAVSIPSQHPAGLKQS